MSRGVLVRSLHVSELVKSSDGQCRLTGRLIILICFPLFLAVTTCAEAADEAALKKLWDEHLAKPTEHATTIAACQRFARTNPDDPLVPVVNGIEAWHHLKMGNREEAEKLLTPFLGAGTGSVMKGARQISKGWLSRFDRDKVTTALQAYYRKEVGYPEKLEEVTTLPKIPSSLHPPMKDRFGNTWKYELVGFEKLPGFANQRYKLQSPPLGETSDLKEALKTPYGKSIAAKPQQVWDREPPLVKFASAGKGAASAVSVGEYAGDVLLAFAGKEIVVVCNHSYWMVFPRP